MKCPKCKKEIDMVVLDYDYSRKGYLIGNKVKAIGVIQPENDKYPYGIVEIVCHECLKPIETIKIECC